MIKIYQNLKTFLDSTHMNLKTEQSTSVNGKMDNAMDKETKCGRMAVTMKATGVTTKLTEKAV